MRKPPVVLRPGLSRAAMSAFQITSYSAGFLRSGSPSLSLIVTSTGVRSVTLSRLRCGTPESGLFLRPLRLRVPSRSRAKVS
jgi:hypothetical protein